MNAIGMCISNTVESKIADPYGLIAAGELLVDTAGACVQYKVSPGHLRWLRRRRLVRYVDKSPEIPAGTGGLDRYEYAARDLEAHRAYLQAAKAARAKVRAAAPAKTAPSPQDVIAVRRRVVIEVTPRPTKQSESR